MPDYKKISLTVNVETMRLVDAVNFDLTSSMNTMGLVAGGGTILCISCVDNSGTAYPLGASDTFDLSVDSDFVHTLYDGELTAPVSGTVTSIAASGFSSNPDDTGTLMLLNLSGDLEYVDYLSYVEAGGVYTFTVPSTTLAYVYPAGSQCNVCDPLMAYAGSSCFDVPGDWASINRTTGKISARVFSTSNPFWDKIGTSRSITGHIQINRFVTGNTTPTTLLLDDIECYNRVRRAEGIV